MKIGKPHTHHRFPHIHHITTNCSLYPILYTFSRILSSTSILYCTAQSGCFMLCITYIIPCLRPYRSRNFSLPHCKVRHMLPAFTCLNSWTFAAIASFCFVSSSSSLTCVQRALILSLIRESIPTSGEADLVCGT